MAKGDRLAQQGKLAAETAQPLQALMAWMTYFQHGTEENIMNQIAWPPVVEAWKHLQELSADEETRRLAEVRERALKDEIAQIGAAERRGEQRGIAIGEERGIAIGEERGAAKVKQELLQNLIKRGMSEEQARHILKLD